MEMLELLPFSVSELISTVLLLGGTAFILIASIGLLRMPDVYLRLSVTSKAATLGVMLALLATIITIGDLGVTSRAVAVIIFMLLTAPVGAHMVGRAAHRAGVPLWEETAVDELREYVENSPAADVQPDAEWRDAHSVRRGSAGAG
jgi:multicomponent Na+:H+ antiporter subunit G